MEKRRVVVTGIGVVSPLGGSLEQSWANLMARKSGISKIASFDASHFPTQIAAQVTDYQLSSAFSKKLLKQTVPCSRFALSAAEQAFADAGIAPTDTTAPRWGTVVGAGMMTSEYEYWKRIQAQYAQTGEIDIQQMGETPGAFFNASDFAKTISNIGSALLTQHFNLCGYSSTVHTACASGGQALGLAMQVIRRGDADFMLAGGYDSMINPFGLSSFCLLGAMSKRNDEPTKASRPFDYNRDGFVLGEGAAFLILEEMEKAKSRGARIYAELAGEGNSLSSYRITDSHPSGDGAIQALQSALDDAGVTASEVDYVNAHGTSTRMNDLSETNAMKAVFAKRSSSVPVSSTKSQTGHLIAAAGALEGAFTVYAMQQGKIPMTMNYDTPDPDCDMDYVAEGPRELEVNVAMSNSFGFGGSNSCIVFKKTA